MKKEVNTKLDNLDNNSIIRETITYDNTPIFNKILICLYIIIALLVLNIIIFTVKSNGNGSSNNNLNTSNTTDESIPEEYDVSSFKEINVDEFIDAYNGDTIQLIYIGSPECGFCHKFVPVLTTVQEKYNFQTLYLNISNIDQDEANQIIELNTDFFTNENTALGLTPSTLLVKNGEIVDYQIGASDESTLETLVSQYFDKK